MSDGAPSPRPTVFTIPAHRSFADSLAAGLIARQGRDPLALAGGRILLPNNRAVRALTEAFVRASGSGLVLPRLIAIGDPDLDDRIGGALDPADNDEPVPRAIDPLARQLALAAIVRARRGRGGGSDALGRRPRAHARRPYDRGSVRDPSRLDRLWKPRISPDTGRNRSTGCRPLSPRGRPSSRGAGQST